MKKWIAGLIIFAYSCISISQTCGEINVIEAVDGDTLRAELTGVPFARLQRVSIRIDGIDTPEIHGKCEKEKEMAQIAKRFLNEKLKTTEHISFDKIRWDKYGGRILAEILFDGNNVSQMMINNGLAYPYHGEKKINHWCE